MGRKRLRLRGPRGGAEILSAAVVVLAVLVLAVRMAAAAAGALKDAWPVLLALGLLAGAGVVWRFVQVARGRRREAERLAVLRITMAEFDVMDDRQFEHALRDLLIRDGWPARRVGGGGDQAADVIGNHAQRGRIVVQAKHTRVGGKVGAPVMYAVKGTAGPPIEPITLSSSQTAPSPATQWPGAIGTMSAGSTGRSYGAGRKTALRCTISSGCPPAPARADSSARPDRQSRSSFNRP